MDPNARRDPYEFKPQINQVEDNPHRVIYDI